MFTIKESSYKIEYEGLHMLCLNCGKYGHCIDGCKLKSKEKDYVPNGGASVVVRNSHEMNEGKVTSVNKNGPWKSFRNNERGGSK